MKKKMLIVAGYAMVILNASAMGIREEKSATDTSAAQSSSGGKIKAFVNTLNTFFRQIKQAAGGTVKGFHPGGEKEALTNKINDLPTEHADLRAGLHTSLQAVEQNTPRATIDVLKQQVNTIHDDRHLIKYAPQSDRRDKAKLSEFLIKNKAPEPSFVTKVTNLFSKKSSPSIDTSISNLDEYDTALNNLSKDSISDASKIVDFINTKASSVDKTLLLNELVAKLTDLIRSMNCSDVVKIRDLIVKIDSNLQNTLDAWVDSASIKNDADCQQVMNSLTVESMPVNGSKIVQFINRKKQESDRIPLQKKLVEKLEADNRLILLKLDGGTFNVIHNHLATADDEQVKELAKKIDAEYNAIIIEKINSLSDKSTSLLPEILRTIMNTSPTDTEAGKTALKNKLLSDDGGAILMSKEMKQVQWAMLTKIFADDADMLRQFDNFKVKNRP